MVSSMDRWPAPRSTVCESGYQRHGLRRWPWHSPQAMASRSNQSFHQISSPVWASSKSGISSPVPKQPVQPAVLGVEGKHARIRLREAAAAGRAGATRREHRRPGRPRHDAHQALAVVQRLAQRLINWNSVFAVTPSVATGSSMVCSLKRFRRGQRAVGTFTPSTRSSR